MNNSSKQLLIDPPSYPPAFVEYMDTLDQTKLMTRQMLNKRMHNDLLKIAIMTSLVLIVALALIQCQFMLSDKGVLIVGVFLVFIIPIVLSPRYKHHQFLMSIVDTDQAAKVIYINLKSPRFKSIIEHLRTEDSFLTQYNYQALNVNTAYEAIKISRTPTPQSHNFYQY